MISYDTALSIETVDAALDIRTVACPKCSAGLVFTRSPVAEIDACGFEIYRIECAECSTSLAGIIDPADDALLLSQIQD
jgi:hypothetical protein